MNTNSVVDLISQIRSLANIFIENELEKNKIEGILPAHGSVLFILFSNKKGVPMKKFVDKTGKAKSTITSIIATLQKYGYVTKQQNSHDARSNYVMLTEKGCALEKVFHQISENLIERIYSNIEEKDQQILLSTLSKIAENLK